MLRELGFSRLSAADALAQLGVISGSPASLRLQGDPGPIGTLRSTSEASRRRLSALVVLITSAMVTLSVHPHLFRHAPVRQIVRTTKSLPIAHKQAGWSLLQMAYLSVGDEEVGAAMELVAD